MTIKPNQLFWGIATLHVLLWTLIPILLHPNGPLDVLEGIEWGRHFELGYDKHPPLAPWLTYIFYIVGGGNLWSIYFFAQVFVIIGFWYIWQLAKEFLPERTAVMSVLILEGIFYFTHTAIKFNPDGLLLTLWPMVFYYAYKTAKTEEMFYWVMLGLTTGLSFLTKYTTLLPLLCLKLFFLHQVGIRETLKHKGYYLCAAVLLLVVGPHIYWLIQHDFSPFTYTLNRLEKVTHWTNHILYPAQFLGAQIATLLPTLLLGLPFWQNRRGLQINFFDWYYVTLCALGPLMLTLTLSLTTGMWLYTMWAVPLFSLTGLLYAVTLKPAEPNDQQFNFFIKMLLLVMALMVVGYAVARQVVPQFRPKYANVHFPGQPIARYADNLWQDHTNVPLVYVAGPRWIVTNICTYSAYKPVGYFEWSDKASPWVPTEDLLKKGALFVWEVGELGETIPEEIQKRFPEAKLLGVKSFAWWVNRTATPVNVAFALLPPEGPKL